MNLDLGAGWKSWPGKESRSGLFSPGSGRSESSSRESCLLSGNRVAEMAILIVDDTPVNLFLLENILEEEGYGGIVCVGSAEEALGLLSRNISPCFKDIDIILLDAAMPGMDGIEACRLVKADERTGDIPVILMTVRDDQEVLDQAFAAGASDYIVKPIKVGELLARVRATLQLKREIDRRKEKEFQVLLLSDRLAEYHPPRSGEAAARPEEDSGNKIFFDKLLKMEWDRAKREALPLSVVLLALVDGSGKTPEAGEVGQDVRQVRQVAESLAAAVKRPGDTVLQYEYAVFAAILPNTGSAGALVVADSFRQKISEPGRDHDREKPEATPGVSIGVATLTPVNGSDYRTLLIQALAALHSAEKLGDGRIEIFPRPDEEIVQIKIAD